MNNSEKFSVLISKQERALEQSRFFKVLLSSIAKSFGYINGLVLDVGCGHGFYMKKLENRCKSIIGIDILGNFDKSKMSSSLNFCVADALELPFKEEVFDAVVSFDVIEHIQDDLGFLKGIKRVMKKNALIILGTPNKDRLSVYLRKCIGKKLTYPCSYGKHPVHGDLIHHREYAKEDLKELFINNADFKNVKIRGAYLGLLTPNYLSNRLDLGLSKFPKCLEKFSQYWLVNGIK